MRRTGISVRYGGVALAWLLSGFVSSCGGGGGGTGQCAGNNSCGGNVVGTWSISNLCVQNAAAAAMGTSCPQTQVDASGLMETGTITFNSDMTYASTATLSGTIRETLPSSCLMSQGVTVTCAQLNTELQTLVQAANSPFSGGSCAQASSGCACSFQVASQTSTESGTYSVSGSTITTMPTGGTNSSETYCVQGSTLTLSSMSMSGMPGASGEVILTKQ
jgi:hypothetical protein